MALAPGLTASERIISGRSVVMTTNSSGEVASADGPWIDLQRTDLLIPAGAIYEVTSAELGVQRKVITLTTATADLRDLLLAP